MNRLTSIALAAALLGGAAVAQAQPTWYIGGNVGESKYHTDTSGSEDGITVNTTDTSDTGYKAFVGVDLSRYFGLEAGYTDLGKLKFNATDGTTNVPGSVKGTGYFVDAVGKFPVGQGVDLFGRVGAFHGKATGSVSADGVSYSTDDSGTDVHYGLGASYAFNRNVSMRAEWERYRFDVFGGSSNTDLFSVGVVYAF